jgi:hypothetical protein
MEEEWKFLQTILKQAAKALTQRRNSAGRKE